MAFATVLGINPMTVELILRYLTKAGFVPQGRVGHSSPHYLAVHLKNLILALAAYLPSEAVEAVRILNDLPRRPPVRNALLPSSEEYAFKSSVEEGVFFGHWIEEQIIKRSHWVEDEYNPMSDDTAALLYQNHHVSMMVEPAYVMSVAPCFDGGGFFYDIFENSKDKVSESKKHPVLIRDTRFTVELLITAGKLLADTLAKQASTPNPDPVPGRTGEGDATLETIKAAGPGSHDGLLDTPASQTRRQRPSNKAQPKTSQGGRQSPPLLSADHARGRVRDAGPSTCNP